ncbi:response regulator [Methyloversatilis sp.]|uniref:response regulator n=1 Tax=Methyloversatilis sp. TaxID=2569862 RepID=UPI00273569D4|nr:response regulator [Methyloversatilis sp.]MDP3578925.1 response regulator [Methyloversatilis sp.]
MHLSQLTLLVVDNNVSVRSALSHQLELAGFGRVLQAPGHERALTHLRGGGVDLVLCELAAPTDGLTLLEAVRSDPLLAELPVVLMSGELNRDAVQKAIALGICDLLVKPFTAQKVIERVLKALRRGNLRAAVPTADTQDQTLAEPTTEPPTEALPENTPPAGPERATILVVDDTPANLQLLAGLFRDSFKVKLASNGDKALAICRSDAPPDLILLDVMMPDMDGFEVARLVREHHASSHTPIIFVSAMTDDASRQKGLALGAIDYVAKPIDPDLLRLRVNNLLQYVEHRKQMQTDCDRLLEIDELKREVARLRQLLPGA